MDTYELPSILATCYLKWQKSSQQQDCVEAMNQCYSQEGVEYSACIKKCIQEYVIAPNYCSNVEGSVWNGVSTVEQNLELCTTSYCRDEI